MEAGIFSDTKIVLLDISTDRRRNRWSEVFTDAIDLLTLPSDTIFALLYFRPGISGKLRIPAADYLNEV